MMFLTVIILLYISHNNLKNWTDDRVVTVSNVSNVTATLFSFLWFTVFCSYVFFSWLELSFLFRCDFEGFLEK